MSVNPVEAVISGEQHPSLRAAVVAAGADWSGSQRQLVRLVTQLEASAEWMLDNVPSCAHWVAGELDVEVGTAREWLRIGRVLRGLPIMGAAFEEGRLSYSKVRTLTRIATVDNEAELCEIAARVAAGGLRIALARWMQSKETPDETEARQHAARGLWMRPDIDGMIVGGFRFPPEPAAVVSAAVNAEIVGRQPKRASADASTSGAGWPSFAQQRADALVELLREGGSAVATEIVLHVRGDGCSLDDGTPVADSVIERIAPDAFLRVLIHDAESRPINASGRHRHPTTRQRRVVRERDRACVDCGATEFLTYDHDPDHVKSKRTVIEELYLRCPPCHWARHERERLLALAEAEARERASGHQA